MRIHREGLVPILISGSIFVINLLLLPLYPHTWVNILVSVVLFLFFAWMLRFFRIPRRFSHEIDNGVIAPADGLIVAIEKDYEHEYFKDDRIKISIFMSIFNVHVNFFPIDGNVEYVGYHPGKYHVASLPKASNDNEHNSVVVRKDEKRVVLFRQIAGFLARRIVCHIKAGDMAKQGTEMGMIKFGSRVDVFLPLDAQVNVKIGDVVRTQKTVLAYFA
ncbi:MAG: phosphatidylserine decarboxylase family protein [Bacteroidales bacterium]|nr:phosphatidylserine decarboxylase family protein [Bacteroidales bacterium]